ncbi:MAG: DNA protecting protein DprA [Candidatus Magasanikbacteria bacterium RIFCSPHIGHO2_02_FULL_51_14]|uniref:DNA protecting protein DprA n=1 Tax=Candidatus Magasanikbacteria bacterium RIFCSPHIGHO2_02_FULL_51_14 TaxID=1798683 RepID=A0A1F6MQH4_9BACT|nr:MAG: DNA protecting protein DprA [Candidatus Magasanikbacteria bacterium RIFCSPHIGHO2_02_FULL_51_14]
MNMKKEIVLSYFPKITHKRYKALSSVFTTFDDIRRASFAELKRIGWEDDLATEFVAWRNTVDEEKIHAVLKQEHIQCVTQEDEAYPDLLKQIYDPPFCLFVRGVLKADEYCLAVVGTRKYSTYGKQVTEELVGELASAGLAIVSGLALGIDGFAHAGALTAGGRTIAVLGSGVDPRHVYPTAHRRLAEKIVESGGAVIAEYPPGGMPSRFTFPRRNRIIAGMSLGTLVTEAGEESGALITAQCALDNGRNVFTVPHNITSAGGIGPNALLKQGAELVTRGQDILDSLNLADIKQFVANKEIIPESPAEAKLLEHLSREPLHIDLLTKQTSLDSPTVGSTLTLMEMKGKVRNLGGMMYVLAR